MSHRLIHPKVIRTLKQTGKKTNALIDSGRLALPPGKRISKNGKIYWETRKDRSDNKGTRL